MDLIGFGIDFASCLLSLNDMAIQLDKGNLPIWIVDSGHTINAFEVLSSLTISAGPIQVSWIKT